MPSTAEIETRVRIPCSWGFLIKFFTGENRPCSRRTLDWIPYPRVGPKRPAAPVSVCVYIVRTLTELMETRASDDENAADESVFPDECDVVDGVDPALCFQLGSRCMILHRCVS